MYLNLSQLKWIKVAELKEGGVKDLNIANTYIYLRKKGGSLKKRGNLGNVLFLIISIFGTLN